MSDVHDDYVVGDINTIDDDGGDDAIGRLLLLPHSNQTKLHGHGEFPFKPFVPVHRNGAIYPSVKV